MNRLLGLMASAALATTACGGGSGIPPTLVVETGCVTASDDKLVLTDLQPAGTSDVEPGGVVSTARQPNTEAYVLIGDDAELRPHVGQQVRVTGEAGTDRVVEIRGLQPMVRVRPTPAPTADSAESASEPDAAPTIGTAYELRLEVNELKVRAVEPTGERCELQPAGAAS